MVHDEFLWRLVDIGQYFHQFSDEDFCQEMPFYNYQGSGSLSRFWFLSGE